MEKLCLLMNKQLTLNQIKSNSESETNKSIENIS